MQRFTHFMGWRKPSVLVLIVTATAGLLAAVAVVADLPGGQATQEQVLRGRLGS